VTGVSQGQFAMVAKRLEVLKELVPELSRVATLWYPDQPFNHLTQQDFRSAAPRIGIQLLEVPVRAQEELDDALQTIAGGDVQGMWIGADALFRNHWAKSMAFATRQRLATLYLGSDGVRAGALVSYGPDNARQHRRAAVLVDRILRGAKPGDLPVEFANEFELHVNIKTAQALGLTIPPAFVARVTDWVE
jgi:putative tryptophan/tyrosine transport system substrate-binding protein